MIWGLTNDQKRLRLSAIEWRPWFAWHVVRLMNGRFAWLRTVNRRRVDGIYWWVYEARRALPPSEKGDGHG